MTCDYANERLVLGQTVQADLAHMFSENEYNFFYVWLTVIQTEFLQEHWKQRVAQKSVGL